MGALKEQSDFEYSAKVDGVEGINDFVKFLYKQYKGSKVSGKACKYGFLAVPCFGRDKNCLRSKTRGCWLYKKYKKGERIVDYLNFYIRILKEGNTDVSDFTNKIKFIRKEMRRGDFSNAGRVLRELKKELEGICLEPLGEYRKENVLSS